MSESSEAQQGLTMIVAPRFAASLFNVTATPTEIVLLCSSTAPGVNAKGEFESGQKPELVLSLSPQSAKELAILLTDLIGQYEKEAGELRTPFIEERRPK